MRSYTAKKVGPWRLEAGITRIVLVTGRWAFKVPQPDRPFRGWMANHSEWRQRRRMDVEAPRGTFFHIVQWSRRALSVGRWEPEEHLHTKVCRRGTGYDMHVGDECKGSSWGLFPEGWRLIDYDRCWNRDNIVSKVYYGHEDWRWKRLERKFDP